jgi:choline dehydrogenase-like flavoprotein
MVFQAYEAAGVKWLPDCGTGDILGYCESTQNTYNGKRHYAANCYKLEPNVTIWTKTLAKNLIVEGKKVIGVEVTRMGQSGAAKSVQVLAGKEVLVCSGVQGSPKLLLLRYRVI